MIRFLFLIKILLSVLLFISCSDEKFENNDGSVNENEWILSAMSTYYYWNDLIDDVSIDPKVESRLFFNSLLYTNDKFSQILNINDVEQLSGVKSNYGFEYILGYIDKNRDQIMGVVLYVHKGTHADKMGIERGYTFRSIDNETLSKDNFQDLLSQEKAIFSFQTQNYEEVSHLIVNTKFNINPILTSNIILSNQNKIGYMCYNQFIKDNGDDTNIYTNELLHLFEKFKSEEINELVVDLRYNPGGLVELSVLLSSLVVPNLDTSNIALKFSYNNRLNTLYDNTGENRNLNFMNYPNSYIGNNISRIFFITGSTTASASEAVINILKPYMDVVIIGEKTFGKNYASSIYYDTRNINNPWVILPITVKLLNSMNESNYDDGFAPTHSINEFSYPLIELGTPEEPLLSFIISKINNDNTQKRNNIVDSNERYFKHSYIYPM